MREEMADVQIRRLAAGAYEVFGPGELMEELVPDLRNMPDLHPAHPDSGIRRVEQHELVEAVAICPRELLDPDGAEVVRDDVGPLPAEMLEQRSDVLGEISGAIAFFRLQVRLVRIREATHVGNDDVEAPRERADVEMPFVVEARPAVDEEERRAGALAYVVIAQAVDVR